MGLRDVLAAPRAPYLMLIFGIAIGFIVCYAIILVLGKKQLITAQQEAKRLVGEAKTKAEGIVKEANVDAKAQFIQKLEEFDQQSSKVRDELKEAERRLEKRADNLDKKLDTLSTKERMLEQGEQRVRDREGKLGQKEQELDKVLKQERDQLLRIGGMGVEEAKSLLLNPLRREVEHDAAEMVEKILAEAKETAQDKSREIVVTAIQRYATPARARSARWISRRTT